MNEYPSANLHFWPLVCFALALVLALTLAAIIGPATLHQLIGTLKGLVAFLMALPTQRVALSINGLAKGIA